MARFFMEREGLHGNEVTLSKREAHHVRNVLRMNRGDALILFDSEGNEYRGKISSVGSREVRVSLTERIQVSRESPRMIVLLQSILRGPRMDFIVQKACELGINWIIPVLLSRSVPRYHSSQTSDRRQRWKKIALEASKQCGRAKAPSIGEISFLEEALMKLPSCLDIRIVLWELAEETGLKAYLKGLTRDRSGGAAVLVGPEGGVTEEEVKLAQAKGFVAVSLGRRILRAETASLAALSLVQYELGDLGST